MLRRAALVAAYLFVSLAIFVAWALIARTEKLVSEDGKPPAPMFFSLQKQIDGTAGAPFTYRRLIADTAPALADLVPRSARDSFTDFVRGDSSPAKPIRKLFDFLQWPPERYPELVAGYLLIWLAVLGFLVAFAHLIRLAYDGPAWLPHAAAFVAGVLLLGGCDTRHWASYPYDLPNVFVFTLALLGIFRGAWWTLPAFAVACWSKETALVLIPAFAWVNRRHWKHWLNWLVLLLMVAIWVAVRQWIRSRFPDAGDGASWGEGTPARNLRLLMLESVYGLWWTVPAAVVLIRVWLLRREMPPHTLTLLAGMAAVLIGAGFFKGWIEERRQYLELLPLAGVAAVRWVFAELGLSRLITARRWPAGPDSAGGE